MADRSRHERQQPEKPGRRRLTAEFGGQSAMATVLSVSDAYDSINPNALIQINSNIKFHILGVSEFFHSAPLCFLSGKSESVNEHSHTDKNKIIYCRGSPEVPMN